ncbi:MAG: hypothetical protein KDC07_02040 [Chitinophagaceae bacterium]|nr:hypothetical protein [Chitinophagaceae bacterium]MCB9045874.1 hypothetical protein [Chitinophagales bacterium]
MNKWLIYILLLGSLSAKAQDTSIFKYPITMDEVVISATREGWDLQGFIKRVQNDTTFYKAFKSMRIMSYNATNDIRVYNERGKVTASLYSLTHQRAWNGCRAMDVLQEKITGNFYKKHKEYRYYTAELYAYLFFTKDTMCHQSDIIGETSGEKETGTIAKQKQKLKQLIFNPGSKIAGVPFMGDKAAIFEPEVAEMYNFRLASEEYDGEECYVFKATPKAEYKNDVVYNYLATWFRKSDYSIVARDYSLSYNTLAYDFDVVMKVRTRIENGRLLPVHIEYDGNWHVFTQKRERVKFITNIVY